MGPVVMKMNFFVCFMLGSLAVLQPSLNRLVFAQKGLSFAVFVNGAVVFSCVTLLFMAVNYSPDKFPTALRLSQEEASQWWYALPGLMGFILVMAVPMMIKNIGAFTTVVTMIMGQVATSFLWDLYQNTSALNSSRMIGMILVMAGVYFTFRPTV